MKAVIALSAAFVLFAGPALAGDPEPPGSPFQRVLLDLLVSGDGTKPLSGEELRRAVEKAADALVERYGLDDARREAAAAALEDAYGRFWESRLAGSVSRLVELTFRPWGGEALSPEELEEYDGLLDRVFPDVERLLAGAADGFNGLLDAAAGQRLRADAKAFGEELRSDLRREKEEIAGKLAEAAGQRRLRWTGAGLLEREWRAYTEAFVRHFRLVGAVAERAGRILDLATADAAEFRRGHERDYRLLAEAMAAAKPGSPERRQIDARAAELTRPLDRIFRDLREALDALPTADQRRTAGRFVPPR